MPDFNETFGQLPSGQNQDYYDWIKPAIDAGWRPAPSRRNKIKSLSRAVPPDNGEEDLIQAWMPRGAPVNAPAPAATPSQAAPEEDLIKDWLLKEAPAAAKPATVAAMPATATAPAETRSFEQMSPSERAMASARRPFGPTSPNEDLATRWARENPDSSAIRLGAGALYGLADVPKTLAVGMAAPAINADITRRNQAFEEAGGAAGDIGRLGGQILGTAPFLSAGGAALRALPGAAMAANLVAKVPGLPAAFSGAGAGAGINALTSSASDVPLPEQIGTGAAFGAPLGVLGHGVGKLLGAAVDPATAALAKRASELGIPLRLDQISANPMVRFGGSVMQRLPFTGLGGAAAKQQAAFSRAVAKTFGEDADALGTDVMARAKDRIGNVFETTLPQLEAHLNPNVSARLQAISDATQYLPQEDARIVNKHLDDVLNQFTGVPGKVGAPTRAVGAARMGGDQIQALIAKGSPLDSSINGGSSNVKNLASQIKGVLLDSVSQTPTGKAKTAAAYVQKLKAYNEARSQYKNMKTIEDLAEKAPEGNISPALLMGAVRQSFGNMAYGGGGDLANLARVGQRFLKEPPSSGTAERLAVLKALGVLGTGAVGGVGVFDPEHFQRDVALGGTGLLAATLAARSGGAVLKSKQLGKLMVRSGMRNSPGRLGEVLTSGLPALAPRAPQQWNPLALPTPAGQP